MQLRESHPNEQGSTSARRSTRVQIDVLVEIKGEGFAYAGETVIVSMHGALIRTCAQLQIGMPVFVYVHRTGKSARARVVFATHRTECLYGVEFDQPVNIWEIRNIPLDWNGKRSSTPPKDSPSG